ncbi:MAG: glycoside hydrolase family 97 N-terminal domain-containing protein [Luteolibacter sp.]|uniref:glycoside hydrolase family 97 N-terminal domain-containing protein n=1 Tax=Luteolibacter sp. TaxID=1962973 RepID=UPI00326544BC
MIRSVYFILLGGVLSTANAESIKSPDGNLSADVSVVGTRLSYSVTHHSSEMVQTSPLGFTLNGTDCGEHVTIASSTTQDVNETFPSRHGAHAVAKNRYHGKRFTVTHPASGVSYILEMRAYDSGIAFRYELTHSGEKMVSAESSGFVLPAGSRVWSQAGKDVYENIYSGRDIAEVAAGTVMGPPVVSRLPGNAGYVAITQSAPGKGFPNPFLTKSAAATGRSFQVTYPRNGDNSQGATTRDHAYTPWNVVTTGTLDELVNNDIVESVAPAPDPALFPEGADTAWARPGRSVWDWMSRFPGGITAENAKLNSYWASQLGWEYNTVDEGWGHWNNGTPWPEVREISDHAATVGVKVLLWVRSSDIRTKEMRKKFFTNLKAAGVSGFKADFFDFDSVSPASKERVQLVEDILKEAAGYHLVADLHGTGKPLGQFRTYPNLLNMEAIFGKEQFPKSPDSIYPPFTRLLAGPADYTPMGLEGSLRGSQTAAFEIATFISMAGPLITLAERSDTMAKSAFAPLVRTIPCLWDETRVLPGSEIGETCAMARRKGEVWYAAIMNVNTARTCSLALDFLTPGATYQAEIIRDDSEGIEYRTVTRETKLDVSVAAGGGFIAKFSSNPTARAGALPFISNFGTGRGALYAENGRILSRERWSNQLFANRLPDRMWTISCTGTALHPEIDYSDCYQGGSSLKISGRLDATNDLLLYQTELTVTAKTRLSLVFKRGKSAVGSPIQIGLKFADAPQKPLFFDAGESSPETWNTLQLELGTHAGKRIVEVFLRFGSPTVIPDYEARIGGIAFYDAPSGALGVPARVHVEQVEFAGLDSLDAVLKWDAARDAACHYRVYQKNPLTGQLVWLGATAGNSFDLRNAKRLGEEREAVFEVAAVGGNGSVSVHVPVSIALPERPVLTNGLRGTVIGTEGSFQKSAAMREAVYDNDVSTYFDATTADGVWAGLDLGVAGTSKVTAIRYFPRDLWPDRMVGGVFQGANRSDFGDAVVLAKVAASPRPGEFTLLEVRETKSFRYLRYLSPNGGWGNVAEVQFFGPPSHDNPSF